MDNKARFLALITAIFAAAAMRLVPHPPNFSPIAAMALFSGAYLPKRPLAFAAPFGALLLSDLVLGFYAGIGFVYFSFALVVMIGWLLSSRRSPLRIGAAALASAIVFYAITNFAMWLFSGLYPHSVGGLVACYGAAIPFFQNSLAGDLVYTALMFGGFEAAQALLPSLRRERPAELAV